MVIDTVDDVVMGDIGDTIVNTGGVAVRPFWWSQECVEALGHASNSEGVGTTAGSDAGAETSTADTSPSGDTSAEPGDAAGEETGSDPPDAPWDEVASATRGLSGGWITLIALLAVIAVAALAVVAFLLGRGGRRELGRTPSPSEMRDEPIISATGLPPRADEDHGDTQTGEGPTRVIPPFCSQCGSPLNADAAFCAQCGTRV